MSVASWGRKWGKNHKITGKTKPRRQMTHLLDQAEEGSYPGTDLAWHRNFHHRWLEVQKTLETPRGQGSGGRIPIFKEVGNRLCWGRGEGPCRPAPAPARALLHRPSPCGVSAGKGCRPEPGTTADPRCGAHVPARSRPRGAHTADPADPPLSAPPALHPLGPGTGTEPKRRRGAASAAGTAPANLST